jgi:Mn2+/Fe2+ NRAMP family transporter
VKRLLFPILTYLNVIILIALILLFVFDQISMTETIVIYFLFFFLIRFIIQRFCSPEQKAQRRQQVNNIKKY